MTDTAQNNKRIAKNTLLLYIRMLLLMCVSLYTSRVILNALGVEDFGIYNVVGGVVAMMGFLNNSLGTATQRFINYAIGKNDEKHLNKIFSASFICYCIIIFIVIVIAETVGLWFVCNKLIIPEIRKETAFWVYQLSLLTFIISMLSVPYNAVIVAYEKMSAFAYISIIEGIGKLIIALLITISPIDKLLYYAILMCILSICIRSLYVKYCNNNFTICKIHFTWDRPLLIKIFSFSGWMITGTLSQMFSTQGVNILINLFFGPIYNAARSVAMQVYNAVSGFINNFMIAVKPQIIKSYAQGNLVYSYKLIYSSSKISFFLLFILSVTILFETDYILDLWLKNPPHMAAVFTQLTLYDLFVTALYSPIAYISQASGKVRNYQLIITLCFASVFIFSWIFYKLGYDSYMAFVVILVIDIIGLFMRLYILKKESNFPIKNYFTNVLKSVILVFIISIILCFLISKFIIEQSFGAFITRTMLYISITGIIIFMIGLNKSEKNMIKKIILKK